jgi:D-proline reductase (dithiol) PrdB
VVHPDERRDLRLAHASSNFDRSGFVADLNVVYPIDRLHEMAADGRIGSVASRHLSFMGAQPDHVLETLRLDTGPAAAQLLREDGVDVVLLTPV